MPIIHNRFDYNPLRRKLRNASTVPEIRFWVRLKKRRLLGYKFRRQHGVGSYIIDFYCPELRLAVELDGGQHFEPVAIIYDHERTHYLTTLNILVVRFNNSDVMNNMSGVIEELERIVKRRADFLTTPPAPLCESGTGAPPQCGGDG